MIFATRVWPLALLAAVWLIVMPAVAAQRQRIPDFSRPGTSLPPPPPGSTVAIPRMRIGIDPNPKASTNYRQGDWAESIRLMRSTPSNHLHFAKTWSEIEPRAGVFDLDDFRFVLEQSSPLPVGFNLRIVDAGQRNMPAEYRNLAWDSPEMIAHVTRAMETVAPFLGPRPWSYAVGNEIDMYFDRFPSEIPAFGRLLDALKRRLQTLHRATPFTTTFQFQATGRLRTTYAPIYNVLDHVTFTYYPLGANFVVRPPSSVGGDLAAMIAAAQPKAIYLQEFGYPSATRLGSSPELQAQFVRLTFEAIRSWGSTYVLGATYLFQADMPEWFLDLVVKAYGIDTENFRAYIRTLGLRDANDRPKPAWDEYVRQAGMITHR